MIFIKLLTYFFKSIFRNLYWVYNLHKIKKGRDFNFEFPVKVEGKGQISVGNNFYIKKNTLLAAGKNSKMTFGHNMTLRENVVFISDMDTKVEFGSNCKIGKFSEIYIKNDWQIGNYVSISPYCSILSREKIVSGKFIVNDGTNIGDGTIIDLSDDLIIGSEVAIGPNCTLYTHDHNYEDASKPAWKGGLILKKIEIEDGVWIGSNVTILPGVKIGRRAIIASGALVNKDVPAETIYGGIPAKMIKNLAVEKII